MIYYCPLESYKQRYTMQLSAPKTGWLERNWIEAGIEYARIDGNAAQPNNNEIKHGVALDATGRSIHCFNQITELLHVAEHMTKDDVIYFDDFWHPGIEALPYAFQMMGRQPHEWPEMYANLWAQSVDEFDFTYPMRRWMRHFEKGIGRILDGIFVATPMLKDLVVHGGIAPEHRVHAVGHPFSSEEVKSRMPSKLLMRQDNVVYSSRWDKEKNPDFFLEVVDYVMEHRPDTTFTICTSAPKLKSNDPALLSKLQEYLLKYPSNLILRENLTKEQYYEELCASKVQINTADQDWISYVLLEASCAGTYPVYPYFRSFPETFKYQPNYMYQRLHAPSAGQMVISILDSDNLWTPAAIKERAWIHERFDTSWKRMAYIMGVIDTDDTESPFLEKDYGKEKD